MVRLLSVVVLTNGEASAPLWAVLSYDVAALASADKETTFVNDDVSKLVEREDHGVP